MTNPTYPNPSEPGRALLSLPVARVSIDAGATTGPLEAWRHAPGHGGVNSRPLPDRVVEGAAKLRPRLIRVFLQEFFRVCPGPGQFDWSRLDPYMDSLARTGAHVVAAITMKPRALFPAIDQTVWRPSDVAEWQRLIAALVKRYSVDRRLVTHWEIGNETDIGEDGGCPYLIPDPGDYADYYRMTIRPILDTLPEAKVGGPAATWVEREPLPGFVEICRRDGTPLHFISWHLYSDDPERHAAGVEKAKALLAGWPGPRPEMMVTEWSKSFDPVSVEDLAFDPGRAAIAAASILAMRDAGLDWSFYYHLWDQTCYPEEFEPFFSPRGTANMARHWNEVPHRFGLFGVGGEARPQYFLYQMLARMGDEQIAGESADPRLKVLAARDTNRISVLLVNRCQGGAEGAEGRIATIDFSHLPGGVARLTVYRIDAGRRWSAEEMELLPAERREVAVGARFECQVYCPADSVTRVELAFGMEEGTT